MDSLYTTTYIGNKPGAEDILYSCQRLIDKTITIESAVPCRSSNIFQKQ
jgi:hypothetical protein